MDIALPRRHGHSHRAGRICIAAPRLPHDICRSGRRPVPVTGIRHCNHERRVLLATRLRRHRPSLRPLAKKRKRSLQMFSGYESFVYLLTELEEVVDSGTIRWSRATATAAKVRLTLLETALSGVIKQIRNDEPPL
jgi:hypothetical protein